MTTTKTSEPVTSTATSATTPTRTSAPPQTLDALIPILWPRPIREPVNHVLRLVARMGHDESDAFFIRRPTSWEEIRSRAWSEPNEPGFGRFLRYHQDARVSLSPVAFVGPHASVCAPVTCLWAHRSAPGGISRVGIRAAPSPDDLARARAHLEGAALAPNLLLNGGDAYTAIWLLSEPVDDRPRIERVIHRLATLLGDPLLEPVSLAKALIPVPGTRVPIFPSATVRVENLVEDRVALGDVETWLDRSSGR